MRLRIAPVQVSQCSVCLRQLRERTRKPCPTCGSINRIVSVTAHDRITAADKAN